MLEFLIGGRGGNKKTFAVARMWQLDQPRRAGKAFG